MSSQTTISKFLNEVITQLNSISESDIKKLDSGDYSLGIKILKRNQSLESKYELSKEKIDSILNKLRECNNRDFGYDILNFHFKNKKELEFFAKTIDIYIMKQDKVDQIKDKIIEGTVGAALRSSAIQESDK